MDDVLSEIASVVHATYPEKWVVVPPSAEDPTLVIYTRDKQAVVEQSAPATFVVLDRATGATVTWGQADSSADALAIASEWLSFPDSSTKVA